VGALQNSGALSFTNLKKDVDTETEITVRLGKKKENKENRSLLLTVKDEKIKWRIISRGKMLRGNKDWDNVF